MTLASPPQLPHPLFPPMHTNTHNALWLSHDLPPSLQCQFSVRTLIFHAIIGLHKQIPVPGKLSQSMINLVFIPRQPFKQHRAPGHKARHSLKQNSQPLNHHQHSRPGSFEFGDAFSLPVTPAGSLVCVVGGCVTMAGPALCRCVPWVFVVPQ